MPDQHSVYMPAKNGPFRCSHCEYFTQPGQCDQPQIIALAKQGKFGLSMDGALAKVDPGGCSDYFEPRDEFEGDSDDAEVS